MESRVYSDKQSTLNLVSAPTGSVVVFGCGSVGGAPGPLEELRFGFLASPGELGNVSRPAGRKSKSHRRPINQDLRPCTKSSFDVR